MALLLLIQKSFFNRYCIAAYINSNKKIIINGSAQTNPCLIERYTTIPNRNSSKHNVRDRKNFATTYISLHLAKRLLHKKRKDVVKKDIENIKYFKDSSSLKLKLCPVAPYKTNKNNPTPTRQVAYK
ncbi:MAG TPA: hypothetical protein PLX17_07675 [Chitinophagaceae bacterium]|nr:hypothetical protein [Chitinophagaceae bacterium]